MQEQGSPAHRAAAHDALCQLCRSLNQWYSYHVQSTFLELPFKGLSSTLKTQSFCLVRPLTLEGTSNLNRNQIKAPDSPIQKTIALVSRAANGNTVPHSFLN